MKIWISAGEVSGDALGALLADALRRVQPAVQLAGIAGPAMRERGVASSVDALRFAHAGWSSVLQNLPDLVSALRSAGSALDAFAPDLFVAIDSPGLNRILLRRAVTRGCRVAWLAPPQLWAWKNRRIPALEGMDVYPLHAFETDALEKAGARPHWLGYPGPRPAGPTRPGGRLLVLFPGTRHAWRKRHERLFREAAQCAGLDLDTVVAVPHGRTPGPGEMKVDQALEQASLALAMPGTGVLEASLRRVPTLVAASPGRMDLWVGRRRLEAGPLSLPNRILGSSVLPELLECPSAVELGRALGDLWSRREEVSSQLAGLEERLGEPGAMERIAQALLGKG